MFLKEKKSLAEKIDAILPQTQCRQCGYEGCKPYAEAIACGQAEINQCPPGGEVGVRLLAHLMKQPYKPLNVAHGTTKPKSVAFIDETTCIGCTLCLPACPVDAILGSTKRMHTIITSECTGCELCLAPCPVDCITIVPVIAQPNGLKRYFPVFLREHGLPVKAPTRYLKLAFLFKNTIFNGINWDVKLKIFKNNFDGTKAGINKARVRHANKVARLANEEINRAKKLAMRGQKTGQNFTFYANNDNDKTQKTK